MVDKEVASRNGGLTMTVSDAVGKQSFRLIVGKRTWSDVHREMSVVRFARPIVLLSRTALLGCSESSQYQRSPSFSRVEA